MNSDLDKYHGREQSYIKHLFLTQYLQAAAYRTLQGRSPTFNFVDAFAGPWRVSDKNYSDASFDQALHTLEAVRANLEQRGIVGLKIRFCFCERRSESVALLREYAKKHRRFDIHIFCGSFEDNLDDIANVCRDGFTFTFIDPTGWNINSGPVLEFLRLNNGEFLLNFMAEHVNRHAEYSQVATSFGRFLADPGWASAFNALSPNWSNERRVLHLLKERMKASKAATFIADIPILKPREQRVKMRLVLGTHSMSGLEVFRDTQNKVERSEIETRNQIRDEHRSQVSLFTSDEIVKMHQNSAGVGCPRFQKDAEDLIIRLLKVSGALKFRVLAIEILENIPLRLTQIKSLINGMKVRGVVSFELPPRKRTPQLETVISLLKAIP